MPRLGSLTSQSLVGLGKVRAIQYDFPIVYTYGAITPGTQLTSTTLTTWDEVRKSDIAVADNYIHVLFRRDGTTQAELKTFERNNSTLTFVASTSITLAVSNSNRASSASIVWDPIRSQLIIVQIAGDSQTRMRYNYVTWNGTSHTVGSTLTVTSPDIEGVPFANSNFDNIHAMWDSTHERITVAADRGTQVAIVSFLNGGSSLTRFSYITTYSTDAGGSLNGPTNPLMTELANGSYLIVYGFTPRAIIANVNPSNGSMSWGTDIVLPSTTFYDIAASTDSDEFMLSVNDGTTRRYTYSGTTITFQDSDTIPFSTGIVYDSDTSTWIARNEASSTITYSAWSQANGWTSFDSEPQGQSVASLAQVVLDDGIYAIANPSGRIHYSAIAKSSGIPITAGAGNRSPLNVAEGDAVFFEFYINNTEETMYYLFTEGASATPAGALLTTPSSGEMQLVSTQQVGNDTRFTWRVDATVATTSNPTVTESVGIRFQRSEQVGTTDSMVFTSFNIRKPPL